jgi:hypothetical protein
MFPSIILLLTNLSALIYYGINDNKTTLFLSKPSYILLATSTVYSLYNIFEFLKTDFDKKRTNFSDIFFKAVFSFSFGCMVFWIINNIKHKNDLLINENYELYILEVYINLVIFTILLMELFLHDLLTPFKPFRDISILFIFSMVSLINYIFVFYVKHEPINFWLYLANCIEIFGASVSGYALADFISRKREKDQYYKMFMYNSCN